jgi:hypothetical protein
MNLKLDDKLEISVVLFHPIMFPISYMDSYVYNIECNRRSAQFAFSTQGILRSLKIRTETLSHTIPKQFNHKYVTEARISAMI